MRGGQGHGPGILPAMQQQVPDRDRRYTEAEYLRISAASDVKYEFRDGYLIPFGGWERDAHGRILGMAGGTATHSDVSCNLIHALKGRLSGRDCKVGSSDLRVRIPRSGRYVYPDVSVTCGPRLFDPPDDQLTLANPQVVIEVLSPSTADADRSDKLTDYIGIDSLQQYVLVAQDRPRVDTVHRRPDGSWAIGPWVDGPDGAVEFPSLGVTLPMAEVYAGVEFPPPAGR